MEGGIIKEEQGLTINLLQENKDSDDTSPCRFCPCFIGSVFVGVITMSFLWLAIQF